MVALEAMPIKVAIVEDDDDVRASMESILLRAANCSCTGSYGNAEDALREIPRHRPQVVLMDINLPGMSGVDCVRQLARLVPGVQVIMLTVYDDADSIFKSLAAGASGYLLKPIRAAELLTAVRDANAGGAPMTSNIARKVVQSFKKSGPAPSEAENLAAREMEVLELLAKGYIYKEVADALHISYSTVHTHIERIYHKLHVRSRGQAVAKYLGV
jgi:DNA-binding NarL/FixJ family response regulator